MPLIFIAFYILLSLFVGFLGRYTRPGPWVMFVLSLILTPVVVLLLRVVFRERSRSPQGTS
jgi:membrane protein implicated in regulation of membrane protease activity